MSTLYQLIKISFLDPLFLLVLTLGSGFLLLRRYKDERSRFSARLLLVAFLFLYILSISPVNNFLFYILEKDYIRPNVYGVEKLDVVVVLSGGSYGNHNLKDIMPSNETPSRLMHALQLFRLSNAEYIVCSGKGVNEISDADVMGQVARRMGILESRIMVEPKSRNTMEHAKELNKIFKDKNLKIGLITSGYHMKRSEREFSKYFKNIISLPSEYYYSPLKMSLFMFMPSSHSLYKSTIAIRELVGNLWYKIRY